MISLKLTETKKFMSQLLLSDTFDRFNFIEGEIVTFGTFRIDGYLQKEFFDTESEDSLPEYASWAKMRDYCFSIIKGKHTPLSFKFIFSLSPEQITQLITSQALDFQPQDVQGLYLNIRFDDHGLQCITGTSLKTFTLDKSLEKAWDQTVQKFFDKKEIAFDVEA